MRAEAPNLEEYRIRASRLMKQCRAGDPAAVQRFRRYWPDLAQVQRKHALAVIAREAGFRDWPHLRHSLAAWESFDTTRLFSRRSDVFLNIWFARYEQAREVHEAHRGRFLFPFRHQFVLCQAPLLENLGVDTSDSDWDRIGRDWVKPLDPAAYTRLAAKLRRVVE
jgi:hypothetical protein